jgi:SAM-dependent methyltransferase
MEEQKKVLVICSSPEGSDFNKVLNNNLKLLFGPNPNYTFCDGNFIRHAGKSLVLNAFPACPFENTKYDFVWFAGCNLIHDLFRAGSELISLEKLKNILEPNGYFIFTESEKYVDRYSTLGSSLTLPLEIIDLHSKKVLSKQYSLINAELIFDYFKQHFVKVQLGVHVVYQLAKEGGYRLKKKSYKYIKKNRRSFRNKL